VAFVTTAATSHRPFVERLKSGPPVHAVFVRTPTPRGRGPGLGTQSLDFLDSKVGFAATTGGGAEIPKLGWQQPTGPGRIQLTTDGGSTWRTLWSGRGIVFSSIAFSGRRDGVASANDVMGFDPRKGGQPAPRPVVLATHDGGSTWRRVQPPFSHLLVSVQPVTASTWIALAATLRRTDDGGATWRTVALPAGAETVRFATPLLGYAGATGSSCPKLSQLWRTNDGGATWTPLPGTCGPDYVDIDTVNSSLLLTAQTLDWEEGRYNVIRRSEDGGDSWQTLHEGRWLSLARVAFSDARHGWAVSHECAQGFGFDALHVTTDGGRTWQSRTAPLLPSAFSGSRFAWAGNETDGVVWRTTDSGRTWRPSVSPEHIGAGPLRYATRRQLALDTVVGTVRVELRKRVALPRPKVSEREAARALGKTAYLAANQNLEGRPLITTDGGRSWRALRSPRRLRMFGDVAFTDPRHGLLASGDIADGGMLPVYATRDAGRSWRRLHVPQRVQHGAQAALAPGAVFIPNGIDPPRYSLAFLSSDDGAHWQTTRLPASSWWQCHGAGAAPAIWISCAGDVSPGSTVLLISPDRGKSWTEVRARRRLDSVIPVAAQEAWATSGGTLWHTVDAGHTWRQVWLRVPSDVRGYFIPPRGYFCYR
jgi:photosystem II stability/assembly factor-like uncharacterized protein